jgi:hypothetical protein
MLGNKIDIKTSNSCSVSLEPSGDIVLYAPSQPANIGPHVMLGGTNALETTPVVKTDKLVNMLTSLITNIASSIVATPAGPSSPLTNSAQISALIANYLNPVSPNYIGSNTTRVK